MTFVVPVYNTAEFLPQCLNSLLVVDVSKEIIVINDGSTDNSLDILQDYAAMFPSIRIFNQENKGVSAARNVGIKNAKGRFIQFVDSDDYLPFNMYNVLLDCLVQSQCEVLVSNVITQAPKGQYILRNTVLNINAHEYVGQTFPCLDYLNQAMITPSFVIGCWRMLLSTDFLRRHQILFDESLSISEDNLFWLAVCSAEPEMELLEMALPIYYYHYRDTSAFRKKNLSVLKAILYASEVLEMRLKRAEVEPLITAIQRMQETIFLEACRCADRIGESAEKQALVKRIPSYVLDHYNSHRESLK